MMHNIKIIRTLSNDSDERSKSKERIKKQIGFDDIKDKNIIKKVKSYKLSENNEDNVRMRVEQKLIKINRIKQLQKNGKVFNEKEIEQNLNNPDYYVENPNELNERLFGKNKGYEYYRQYTGKFNEEYPIKSPKKGIIKKQSFTPDMEIYNDGRKNY